MALLQIKNVSIRGISASVPKHSQSVIETNLFSPEDAEKFSKGTGVYNRRIVSETTTASDLCFHAAEQLIRDLNWNKNDIDCLIFVSQTPDYILPATSIVLQNRLNLKNEVIAFDISLGCSGWIYGLYTIANLLSSGQLKRGLLLVGDTISKTCSTNDKSTFPLFGDAGTATAIEFNTDSEGFRFHLASDGSGSNTIIIPDGGFRSTFSDNSLTQKDFDDGISRTPMNLILDGMSVFSFGIAKAPESVNFLLENNQISTEDIDYFIFHQANLFMNEKIRKKLKIPAEKVPYSLADFGNTSSATIPLTIIHSIRDEAKNRKLSLIACGFGVGLSWGSVYFNTDKIICPELIEIDS